MTHKIEKTPRVDEEVDVMIDSMAFGGEGVARYGNYVLFVPDVIPGEKVRVKITAAKRSYGRGDAVQIIEPSSERIEPPCEVYGVCGGCQYQHVSYEKSLAFKEQQLKEVILRIGGISIDDVCDPIHPAQKHYDYRNVISLRVMKVREGWQVGYCARDNKTFVPISHCPIASEAINRSIGDIGDVLTDLEQADKIKDITVKHDGEQTLFSPGYRKPFRLKSRERLSYRYKDLVVHYGLNSFFQTNHSMIPKLIDSASEGLDPTPGGTLFDLYAGVGLFSIALAEKFHQVVGIEWARESVGCFQDNIRENGLQNVTVVRGAVERVLKSADREFRGEVNSVLVDPPREGMKEDVIQFLNKESIHKLVYVSCDPATLARDLKLLKSTYSIRKITPLDMFPQTKHLEAVAVLERNRH